MRYGPEILNLLVLLQLIDQFLLLVRTSSKENKGLREFSTLIDTYLSAQQEIIATNVIQVLVVVTIVYMLIMSIRVPVVPIMITSSIAANIWLISNSQILRVVLHIMNKDADSAAEADQSIVRERLQQKEMIQMILLAANILAFIFSLWVQNKFGQAYKAVELTGKYAVGHREFHSINGNSISVYYPVSRQVAHANRDKQKLYIDDKDQEG